MMALCSCQRHCTTNMLSVHAHCLWVSSMGGNQFVIPRSRHALCMHSSNWQKHMCLVRLDLLLTNSSPCVDTDSTQPAATLHIVCSVICGMSLHAAQCNTHLPHPMSPHSHGTLPILQVCKVWLDCRRRIYEVPS